MTNRKLSSGLAALLLMGGAAINAHAGLLAYYHFDELGGGTAADSVGSANGTLAGGAAFAPGAGISGGAIDLNKALDSWVDMGNNFDFLSDFSVQAWVKLAPGDTTPENPLARHFSGVTAGYFLGINDTGDGCSAIGKAHFYAGYPCSGVSSITVNDGGWHQLVGVYQGGTKSIYVDGQFQASATLASLLSANAPFMIGGINGPTGLVSTYTGLVDEVAVWDHALNANEVLSQFESPGVIPEPGSMVLLFTGALGLLVYRRRVK